MCVTTCFMKFEINMQALQIKIRKAPEKKNYLSITCLKFHTNMLYLFFFF